jgi:DNA-binding MarR family transcriptional regulator
LTQAHSATLQQVPEIGIGKLLRRAHIAFSREFRIRLAEHGITFGEFIHLERLWDEDGLIQRELSRRVGITAASSTHIIETLELRGFIVRKRSLEDRRNINVYLTPPGRQLQNTLLECARSTNRLARASLSTDETLMLFDLVERIIANLETQSRTTKAAAEKRRAGKTMRRSRSPHQRARRPRAAIADAS